MSATWGYDVQIVGSDFEDRVINNPEKFKRGLNKLVRAMAVLAYESVSEKLRNTPFKKSTGRIQQALRWDSGEFWSAVYMDDRIAPHAVYQERGVQKHTMRYLLKATAPIPIPVGNVTIHRWATEKWMGRPHPAVDPHSGLVFMTKGWIHPGYEGHFFMRDGVREAVEKMSERMPEFVFRIMAFGENSVGETL